MDKKLITAEFNVEQFKSEFGNYLYKGIISPRNQWHLLPVEVKLSALQKTPAGMVKYRPVGKDKEGKVIKAPFIEIGYAEKALNFLGNFKWGGISRSESMETYSKNGKDIIESLVILDCWIMLGDFKIEKTMYGAAKTYSNPATSKYSGYQIARANAVKLFAREFGVGADKREIENKALDKIRTEIVSKDWQESFSKVTE